MHVDKRTLLLSLPFLAAGAFLVLQATGSSAVCFSAAPCGVPTDGFEPYRLGLGLAGLVAGSSLMLTAFWRWS